MLRITWFETEEELQELTGLDHRGLQDAGLDTDDMDFGIRVNKKLHADPDEKAIAAGDAYEGELCVDWDREGYWLMWRMQEHCCGSVYVKLGRWHYYLVHHA